MKESIVLEPRKKLSPADEAAMAAYNLIKHIEVLDEEDDATGALNMIQEALTRTDKVHRRAVLGAIKRNVIDNRYFQEDIDHVKGGGMILEALNISPEEMADAKKTLQ